MKVIPPAASQPTSGSGVAGATIREAAGYFTDVTSTPEPRVYVVDSATIIGGKPAITYPPGSYVDRYNEELTSAGTIVKTLADSNPNTKKYTVTLVAPGGGGGGSDGNGGNGGDITCSFTLNNVQHTITVGGGQGGSSGNSGGGQGSGGTFSLGSNASGLTGSNGFYLDTNQVGQDGSPGGGSNEYQPPGGLNNGGPNNDKGNGGNGGYSTTPLSGSFSQSFSGQGSYSYNVLGDSRLPSTDVSIERIDIDLSLIHI